MDTLAALFQSGRIIDLILMLVIVEALVLAFVWRRTGRGITPLGLAANLASGGALLLAVRMAVTDAPWAAIALCLSLSFVAHVADLAGRWRS